MKTLKILLFILFLSTISILVIQMTGMTGLDISDSKWNWIQSKIHDSPRQEIDFVFIGSSRTWCSIKPRQIEKELGVKTVWNFGRHWIGRDIDYLIIKSLLEHHTVKHIMVEMIGQENFFPHQYVQYMIMPEGVIDEARFHYSKVTMLDILTYSDNVKERLKQLSTFVSELAVRLYRKPLSLVVNRISRRSVGDAEMSGYDSNGGFYLHDIELSQNVHFYNQFKNFQISYPVMKGPFMLPSNTFPDFYLKKIKEEAQRNNTKLGFVFISDYAAVLPHDQMFYYFNQLGDIYIPSLSKIYHLEFWRDKNHVFQKGADVMTSEIISLIKNGVYSSEDYRRYESR